VIANLKVKSVTLAGSWAGIMKSNITQTLFQHCSKMMLPYLSNTKCIF